MLSAMEYAHWLMVAGAVLVVLGFIGFAFHTNNAEPVENNLNQEAAPQEEPAQRPELAHEGQAPQRRLSEKVKNHRAPSGVEETSPPARP